MITLCANCPLSNTHANAYIFHHIRMSHDRVANIERFANHIQCHFDMPHYARTSDTCYYYCSLTCTLTKSQKHTTPTTHSFVHSLTHSLHFFRFRCLPSPNIGSDDNNADNDADFKCDKCDNNEGVISSQKETTTILKDNAKPILNKPILKFSVSAILGDKKECARVRHGKCIDCITFT